MSEIDRMDISLWRVFSRYCEALARGLGDIAGRLMADFLKRLRAYENACREQSAQMVLA